MPASWPFDIAGIRCFSRIRFTGEGRGIGPVHTREGGQPFTRQCQGIPGLDANGARRIQPTLGLERIVHRGRAGIEPGLGLRAQAAHRLLVGPDGRQPFPGDQHVRVGAGHGEQQGLLFHRQLQLAHAGGQLALGISGPAIQPEQGLNQLHAHLQAIVNDIVLQEARIAVVIVFLLEVRDLARAAHIGQQPGSRQRLVFAGRIPRGPRRGVRRRVLQGHARRILQRHRKRRPRQQRKQTDEPHPTQAPHAVRLRSLRYRRTRSAPCSSSE